MATFCVTGLREAEAADLTVGSIDGDRGARCLQVTGKAKKTRAIPIEAGLDQVLDTYFATRLARFPGHDLDLPATKLFVDVRGRQLSVDQVKYLIERLYVRAGLRARVPKGALVHALRHTFATSALQAGADVVELQTLLGHASLDTTRHYLDATAEGLRHVVRGHPGQIALRNTSRSSRTRPLPSPAKQERPVPDPARTDFGEHGHQNVDADSCGRNEPAERRRQNDLHVDHPTGIP